MKYWLFNCKEISQLVSRSMDEETSFHRRAGIRFHMMMCRYCVRYEKQLKIVQKTIESIGKASIEQKPKAMSGERKLIIKNLLTKQE